MNEPLNYVLSREVLRISPDGTGIKATETVENECDPYCASHVCAVCQTQIVEGDCQYCETPNPLPCDCFKSRIGGGR